MKDFIKKYHNKKVIWNIWVVAASLIMAFWINFFIIDSSEIWNNLKASVINSENIWKENKADLYIENNKNWIISINSSKSIESIENISFSVIFNPENIEIKDVSSEFNEITQLWNTNWWSINFIINSKGSNIKENQNIIDINIWKKAELSEQINLINANFKNSNWENFKLTTSWITY